MNYCHMHFYTTKFVRKFSNSLKPRFLIVQLLVRFDLTARLITRSWYSKNRSSRSSGIDLYKQKIVVGDINSFVASVSSFSNFTAPSYFPCSINCPGRVPRMFRPVFDFFLTDSVSRWSLLTTG